MFVALLQCLYANTDNRIVKSRLTTCTLFRTQKYQFRGGHFEMWAPIGQKNTPRHSYATVHSRK